MDGLRDKHKKELHNLHFSRNIYLIKWRYVRDESVKFWLGNLSGKKGTSQNNTNLKTNINFYAPRFLSIGQAFRYSPKNAFYIFNQQMYFII